MVSSGLFVILCAVIVSSNSKDFPQCQMVSCPLMCNIQNIRFDTTCAAQQKFEGPSNGKQEKFSGFVPVQDEGLESDEAGKVFDGDLRQVVVGQVEEFEAVHPMEVPVPDGGDPRVDEF